MNPIEVEKSDRYWMYAATYAAVGVAAILIVVKCIVWMASGSVGILASLVDSVLDGFVSLLNLWAVRIAMKPADKKYQFGHAKAEPLASLIQSALIIASAIFLCSYSVDRFIHVQPIQETDIAIGLMVFSIVLTLALVSFQYYVGNRTKSIAIKADALHYTADLYANAAVIIAIVLGIFGVPLADPVIGFIIGVYILYSAMKLAKDSIDFLMDKALPEEDENKIRQIVLEHEGVQGIHELKTRDTGRHQFIQFQLELDASQTLASAYDTSRHVEDHLTKVFPNADIYIYKAPILSKQVSTLSQHSSLGVVSVDFSKKRKQVDECPNKMMIQ